MTKVFKAAIFFEDIIKYSEVIESELPDDVYNKFNWEVDKVHILHFKNQWVLLSISKDVIKSYCNGFYDGIAISKGEPVRGLENE